VDISATTLEMYFAPGSQFRKNGNDEAFMTQQNAAENAYIELIRLNSNNVVAIAPGGGGTLISDLLTVSTNSVAMMKTLSGGNLVSQIYNDSNTASSRVSVDLVVQGTSAGDAFFVARINGGVEWSWGLDNSDSDAFVISETSAAGGGLGTGNRLRIASGGVVTIPNLAGSGSRTVVADANGVLSAP
jgi:hypothetical protein